MTETARSPQIDEHIAQWPPETQELLGQMRSTIQAAAPDAVETFSYGIPTFDLMGKHLVHFAGAQKHVGFYPTPSGVLAFKDELSVYKGAKGSVQFPLTQPLPLDLVRRIVEFRVAEVTGAAKR